MTAKAAHRLGVLLLHKHIVFTMRLMYNDDMQNGGGFRGYGCKKEVFRA